MSVAYRGSECIQNFLLEQLDVLVSVVSAFLEEFPCPHAIALLYTSQDGSSGKTKSRLRCVDGKLGLRLNPISAVLVLSKVDMIHI